jgi:hypothetical protein
MNDWQAFVKWFYASEKKRDNTPCRESGTLKRVAKSYQCHKRMANRKTRRSTRFRGVNPMHKLKKD